MPFPYQAILLIGATSSIGAALAGKFVSEGRKVIAVGRRQERLDAFIARNGKDKAAAIQYGITNHDGMGAFVENTTNSYEDIDCVFINAGIQSSVSFTGPTEVNHDNIINEINTNFTSVVSLVTKFIPRLLSRQKRTSIIFTGSTLSWVPASGLPIYYSTKAALNSFILCLRHQLQSTNVQVIELSPPLLQTELHDYMGLEKGRKFGMPLEVFVEQAWTGLAEGKEEVIIGSPGPPPNDPAFLKVFNDTLEKRCVMFAYLA